MERYVKETEEKLKLDQAVKDRIAEDKLIRHKATLDKIQKQGEDRKAKLVEGDKAFKEINKAKPLYKKFMERYEQDVELKELAQ